MRDPKENKHVDAIALGFRDEESWVLYSTRLDTQDNQEYTLSNIEVLLAVQLHEESELKE